jgi:N6-adenosine-specific RNA methylase IME4
VTTARRIDTIRIGNRHRRDLGDVESLARSIDDIGLLHAVVITPDGELIAGARRLEACRRLGRTEIDVHFVDLDEIVRGEFAENTERKPLTMSEAVAVSRALYPVERAAAKLRQEGGAKLAPGRRGKTRDKVAAFTGIKHTTLAKASAIVDAAESQPDRYGPLLAAMDRSNKVNGPYRRLRNAQQAEQLRTTPPPLPGQGPYHVAFADPPWAYEPDDENAAHRGVLPYSTMSIQQLCDLDVGKIMHPDAIMFLWVTNFILAQGFHAEVLRAWDFVPKTIATWPKARAGRGHWLKGQTEHVVLATRGRPIVTLTDQTTLLSGPFHVLNKNSHSEKPLEFCDFVEVLAPAPRYADIFSRYRHNEKWDVHGDQAPRDEVAP